MANSNSFVLGEECSRPGKIRGGHFRWHKTLVKLAELLGVGPEIWSEQKPSVENSGILVQQGQTLEQNLDSL